MGWGVPLLEPTPTRLVSLASLPAAFSKGGDVLQASEPRQLHRTSNPRVVPTLWTSHTTIHRGASNAPSLL